MAGFIGEIEGGQAFGHGLIPSLRPMDEWASMWRGELRLVLSSRWWWGFANPNPRVALCLLALLVLPIGGAAAQQITPEGGTVKAQHGDWQVVCKPPPPGAKNEVCALVQSVTAEDRNNVGLTVYFQKFSDGKRVLRVFAPLGVLLPPGLGLKIDDKDVGHAPFLRCQAYACYAQVVVEEKLIEQLRHGKTAVFIIFQTEEAGIGIPISLAGFGQALASLN